MNTEEEVTTTEETTHIDTEDTQPSIEDSVKTAEAKGADVIDNGEKVEDPDKSDKEADKPNNDDKKEDESEGIEAEIKEQKQAEADTKQQVEAKGLDWDALEKEYGDNGELSEESMKKLEDAGFSKSMVNAYIRGMEATAKAYVNAVYDMAGGKDAFDRMSKFVASLGKAEVDSFNRAIENADMAQLNNMFIGYKSRMTQRYGTSNPTIMGSGAVSAQGGYANKGAMIKAMSDPRYGSDIEYTRNVQYKVMNSAFLGSSDN